MFGDAQSCAGHDKCCRGGNVEGIRAIAACAAGIKHRIFAIDRARQGWLISRMAVAKPTSSATVSPFRRKKAEHVRNLFRVHFARQHPVHQVVCFLLRQMNEISERKMRHRFGHSLDHLSWQASAPLIKTLSPIAATKP